MIAYCVECRRSLNKLGDKGWRCADCLDEPRAMRTCASCGKRLALWVRGWFCSPLCDLNEVLSRVAQRAVDGLRRLAA